MAIEIEVIHTNGDRRFVKRIMQIGNKAADIDYAIQYKKEGIKHWLTGYFNRSKTKVERRYLDLT
jgi:hypothetical protein